MQTVSIDVVYYIYILLFGVYASLKIGCAQMGKREWQTFCF